MNVKKLILIIFVIISPNLIAQNGIKFGVKAGINLTGFHTGKSTSTDNVLFNFGGLAKLNITDSFSLQTELLYDKKGGLVHVINTDFNGFFSIDTKLDYITLPIRGKFEFIKNLTFDFGPQIGFLINTLGEIVNSYENNGEEVEITDVNTIDFALNAGFTYKFSDKIFLQTNYSYGLTKIFKNKKYKNSVASLSLVHLF